MAQRVVRLMPPVDTFIDTLKSDKTKQAYAIQWKYFQSTNPPPISDPKKLAQHIMSYLKGMKESKLSWSYRMLALSAIKHYYCFGQDDDSDVTLNWSKINRILGEQTHDNDLRGYTREEIQKLLDVANIKYKAIILILASSGMRREALCNIKLENMEKLKEGIYKIKIYLKSKEHQVCFVTPEATKAIDSYIAHSKPEVWLFPARVGRKFDHMNIAAVTIRFGDLAEEAGLRTKAHTVGSRSETPAVHSLRHFCITQLLKTKINAEVQKILVGHSIGKTRSSYVKPSDDELLQEYLTAIPALTIDKSEVPQIYIQESNERVNKLEQELASVREMLGQLMKSGKVERVVK